MLMRKTYRYMSIYSVVPLRSTIHRVQIGDIAPRARTIKGHPHAARLSMPRRDGNDTPPQEAERVITAAIIDHRAQRDENLRTAASLRTPRPNCAPRSRAATLRSSAAMSPGEAS